MHTEEYDIIMLVKFYSTEMLHRVVSPWSSRGWSKFLTKHPSRMSEIPNIHNANTKAVQRDFWIDFDWHFITRSLIYNSVLEGVVWRTALRLKQAREIDTTPDPFHKIERKNGYAILAPEVKSELRHASPRIEALRSRGWSKFVI